MWTARIQGRPDPINLSVRQSRAERAYKKLQLEHGATKVSLIPPEKVRKAFQQKLEAKAPRRKS